MTLRLFTALAGGLLTATSIYADALIKGVVVSRDTGEPIDFANVTLLSTTPGAIPTGTSTDASGAFLLRDVPAGQYRLRISSVGALSDERELTVGNSDIDLGSLPLDSDTGMLQEVVVTATKSQLAVEGERRVFAVSSNISSSGATVEELLAAVPSVGVSHDGDISLRGNADVLVWIDGKEMGMNADNRAQMLRQIPADAVESIEVMTNPSSKHSTEGTAGIINIRLRRDHRHGYFGSAEMSVDTRGTVGVGFNFHYNEEKFETSASLGLKSMHNPAGSTSRRYYDDGTQLFSDADARKHDNNAFLRLGVNYNPNEHNTLYLSAVGTIGHKWGSTDAGHTSTLPGMWQSSLNLTRERGDNRGANILLGFKHIFRPGHFIDANASYNIWVGPNDSRTYEQDSWPDGAETSAWRAQHQDVKISNWEAALDYSLELMPQLRIEAGYKGNYNHENSPASYSSGSAPDALLPMPELYNRFMYDTDISAVYLSLSGESGAFSYAGGLRGEAWQTRTRSLGYNDIESTPVKKNEFALFPSASFGWKFMDDNELKLNYSRRIRRPFGPQLNTFENIADPSEVHLGNPLIDPEYSNAVELTYIRTWPSHLLSVTGYVRSNSDMISHVSFLAPMASDPTVNTMYYGHANVGNMLDAGVEIISRNTLFRILTLTTTLNLYDSRLKAWTALYPLHGANYPISGARQNRFVWSVRCMASVKLPWDLTFQATGRYNSRSVTAQGTLEPDWEVEAGLRKSLGPWALSLICKDIFGSHKSHNILYGNGYTQSISKWSGGRTLRFTVAYTFGASHGQDNDTHRHVDTGGYGEEHQH